MVLKEVVKVKILLIGVVKTEIILKKQYTRQIPNYDYVEYIYKDA